MKTKGSVVWFTGLSGAGKTTVTTQLSKTLTKLGVSHILLDGDEVRKVLSPDLGYTEEDRKKHLTRVSYLCRSMAEHGMLVLAAFLSAKKTVRQEIRTNIEEVGDFYEAYVKCPIEVCQSRDPKGHYKRVASGELTNFVGIHQPYEESEQWDLVLETSKNDLSTSVQQVLSFFEEQGIIKSSDVKVSLDAHGGKLVQQFMSEEKKAKVLANISEYKTLSIDKQTILDVENIATGVFSPLRGFMREADYQNVVENGRLANNLPFTVPVTLAIPDEMKEQLGAGDQVILKSEDDKVVALLRVSEVYSRDKNDEAKQVYGTTEVAHPGVARLMSQSNTLVAGEIELIERYTTQDFGGFNYDPIDTRRLFAEKGWRTVVGFQTRNAPHRAHEHLQKLALEHVDGLFIQPLLGWKKPGDFAPGIIIKAYTYALDHFYKKENVQFGVLTTSMRYAGPREAVFHAIIRKNFGCTHFIIGRDHAGVGGYYGKYDGHRLSEQFPDLGITIMKLHGPYYCKACENLATEHTCPHSSEHHLSISGTQARKMLLNKEFPPQEFMRREIAQLVMDDPEAFIK